MFLPRCFKIHLQQVCCIWETVTLYDIYGMILSKGFQDVCMMEVSHRNAERHFAFGKVLKVIFCVILPIYSIILFQSFRPFIITKDMLQKQVYGLGYPGMPTVTIEEFMDEKIEMGQMKVSYV